ncbi:MAG: TRAP transporter substrate-binding protein DctP, partial [Alphaproteobacteria bacterium]|nr:TRAP transporter substrate-binding protein DctP [Alphaproteobacteria bacterium]
SPQHDNFIIVSTIIDTGENELMKSLLKFLIFSITLTILSACQPEEQAKIEWKLQSQAVENSIDFQQLITFAEDVKVMSNGKFIITPYSAGKLAHGPNIFNAVKERKVEMGNGWPNWWSGQHPAWAVMNAGPFDFMNLDASMMFFLAGEGTQLANDLSVPEGIIWRPAWWAGMEFGILSREPIAGLNDLRGKRVRIGPGLPSEVLTEASGSYSIPLVPEEIRPALESGDIDAVEWTTTNGVLGLGINDVSPYAIVPAIWQPSVLADFLINQQAYSELPDSFKRILEVAIKSYTLTTTMKAKVADIQALEQLREADTKFSTWSDEDIERWREATAKITEQYKSKDAYTKQLIEKKQSFKNEYNSYYEMFGPYE